MSQIENEKDSSCAESQDLQTPLDEAEQINSQKNSLQAKEQDKIDSDTYKKVLEKLDITEDGEDIQEKFTRQDLEKGNYVEAEKFQENSQNQIEVEKIVTQDFLKIQSLVKLGLINPWQEQNLKNQVLKKAFDTVIQKGMIKQNSLDVLSKDEVFNEFNKDKPDFFNSEGRKEVLDYLKSDVVKIGKDELKKISNMVEIIEQKAIERYLKKDEHEKTLKNSNELAKQKLTANAQNSSFQDKNLMRTFTREQIGKMSSVEFTKYESLIMEQLKKGLIK